MTDEQWDSGLTLSAWDALKVAHGSIISTSAVMPKTPFAAVATINAAIVALVKAFSDCGIVDGAQVNSVLPGPVLTNRQKNVFG